MEDKETRRQGEGERGRQRTSFSARLTRLSPLRFVSLSPPLLVSLFLLLPLLYFYPVFTNHVLLAPSDGWGQNLGARVLIGRLIAAGEWPLWNPYIFGGMPLMASIFSGAFYPLNWVFAFLSPGVAMNVIVIATFHLALIGTYLYARSIGIVRVGAMIAGVGFTFGAYMINHIAQTSRIAAACWLPWVLLAIEKIVASRDGRQGWRWATLGAVFIALQFFAGEPQMMFFTALTAAPVALFALWRCPRSAGLGAARRRAVFWLALMIVCGVLFCLPELLPARALLLQSERSDPGPLFFDTSSLPPSHLPALVVPYFFGGAFQPPYHVPFWGKEMVVLTSGYIGMLSLLLVMIASLARRNPERARIWLWLGIAIGSLVLAFGGYLPFELNHLLYRVPGYNAFRGLYRHQFELSFALAMLAGMGANRLREDSNVRRGAMAAAALVALVVLLYRFATPFIAGSAPLPPGGNMLTNAELLIPLICFTLSLLALWFYSHNWPNHLKPQTSTLKPAFLLAVLLLDLAAYGHAFHWRTIRHNVAVRLADPPAVAEIKRREPDCHSFRVMSQPLLPYDFAAHWPEDPNYEAINQPNISIVRGLQSVSGYDVLRPARLGELSGSAGSAINGFVQDAKSFGLEDRGLDLLNVKYVLAGRGGATGRETGLGYDGVYFARTPLAIQLAPGERVTLDGGGATATELALVTTAANSTHLPTGTPLVKVLLHTKDGHVMEREVQAGRDTAEWAYDRADVRPVIKHTRAHAVTNKPAGEFNAHDYLGRLSFDRAEIASIEFIYAHADAMVYLLHASLYDANTQSATPLAAYNFPAARWQQVGRFDQVDLYENLNALPRAWLVGRVIAQPAVEILQTIKTGRLSDGAPFDPRRVALVEIETSAKTSTPAASDELIPSLPRITHYSAGRIELIAQSPRDAWLVLSETYDEGWQARVNGQTAIVRRVNYTARGLALSAGEHRVEFTYCPHGLRQGFLGAVLAIILLLAFYPWRAARGARFSSLNCH